MRLVLRTLVVLSAVSVAAAAEPARRNIVLIVADDLGLDLGCYGNSVVQTPRLDALASRGTRFENAFATVASCSASRAVIYTGLYTHTNGQFGHAHAPAELNTHRWVRGLPRLLRDTGYRTGLIGKLHVLPPEVYPFDVQPGTDDPGGSHVRDVGSLGAQARRFFEGSADRPFLLVVGFNDPHRSAHGFGNETVHSTGKEVRYEPRNVTVPPFLPDRFEVREELAEYYQAISRLDLGVGRILDALAESGRDRETLIVFLSDNGMPFPNAKTTLYDPGVHLPLIVSSPAQRKHGVVNRALASWIDVTPTVLDWAAVKAPYVLPGRSLLAILEDEDSKDRDAVFGSFVFHEITNYYPMRSIRTRRHKYILNLGHPLEFPFASDLYTSKTWQGVLQRRDTKLGNRAIADYLRRPREELYDLEKDPAEVKNVAGDPAYAAILADLRNRLKTWQVETQDPWVVKNIHE